MQHNIRVNMLLIEDNPGDELLLTKMLNHSGLAIDTFHKSERLDAGIRILKQYPAINLVLLDLFLPDSSGIDSFKSVQAAAPHASVIILSGVRDKKIALEAINLGAQDYLSKGDFDKELLGKSILYSLERINFLNQLKESNERYALVSRATNDMVWDWNLETGKVFRNAAGWRKIFGNTYMEDEDIREEWGSRVHPDDREKLNWITTTLKLPGEGKIFELECRVRRDDGSYAYVISRGNIVRNEQGIPIRITGALQDITERKEAEMLLVKRELRFRSLLQNGSGLTAIMDEKGTYLYSSPTIKKILGYEPDELVGKNALSFVHPDDRKLVMKYHSRALTAVYTEVPPFRYKNTIGEWRWLQTNITDMRADHEIQGYIINSWDVTERKNAEEQYRYLFNHNPANIYIWDIESLQIIEANDTALVQYGYPREVFLSKKVTDLIHPEYYEKTKQAAFRANKTKVYKQELMSKHINSVGDEMYMNVRKLRIEYQGKPAMMSLSTNETKKIMLERTLEQERLIKQQEITDAVISAQEKERQEIGLELHDNITQILASAGLYLNLASAEPSLMDEHLEEAGKIIKTAIAEIRHLSHALIPPSRNETNLVEAIEQLINMVSRGNGIEFKLHCQDFNENTLTDKMKLMIYRIVQEQFNNILKYARAGNVTINLALVNGKLRLIVKDDGVGFDTSVKTHGMGLMNIKTRASIFNGEVEVISSPGNGCELKIEFN